MSQELTTLDKLDLMLIQKEQQLKKAKKELNNHNLTPGQTRAVHVEIEKLTFLLKTLKFIKYD